MQLRFAALALLALTASACTDTRSAHRVSHAMMAKPIDGSVQVTMEALTSLSRFDGLRATAENTLGTTGAMLSQYHGHSGGGGLGLGFFGGLMLGAAQMETAAQLETFTGDMRAFLTGLGQGHTVACCQTFKATSCSVTEAPWDISDPIAPRTVTVSCRDDAGNTLDFDLVKGDIVALRPDTFFKTALATTPAPPRHGF